MKSILLFLLIIGLSAHAEYISKSGNLSSFSQLPLCASDGQYVGRTSGSMQCSTPSGGGNVTGPLSSTTNDLAIYADTSGTVLSDSGVLLSSLATLTGSQVLTNKTLTAPIVATISNSGTITVPTNTSALVTLSGTEALTNKSIVSPFIVTPTGFLEFISGDIVSPSDHTYVLDQSAAYAYTINTLVVATASGTTTLALKINGTSVTSISAVSVSSSPTTATATGANSVVAGGKVTLVLSSSSSPADLSFTMKYTR